MAIEKMNLVRVSTPKQNIMSMLESIHNYKWFHPELSKDVISDEDDVGLAFEHEKVYQHYLERFNKALGSLDLEVTGIYDQRYSLDAIETVLNRLEKLVILTKDAQPLFSELEADDTKALEMLYQYPLNDIDEGFVHVMFGKVSAAKFQSISQYHQEPFLYTVLHKTKKTVWIMVLCLKKDAMHFTEVLDSLEFRALPMVVSNALDEIFMNEIAHVYGYVQDQGEIESYFPFVSIYDQQGVLAGFVKRDKVDEFKGLFMETVQVHVFDGMTHETLMPPTSLKNNRFAKPFEMLVEMYGLPQYDAYDPTFFFSLSYSVLFGIMFGDVGQGLVISVIGYLAHKYKKMELGAVMFRVGWFSMFFGFIFGSFFGNESLLEPLLHPLNLPIHVTNQDFTMTLLISTVAMGVFLILNAIVLNIMTGLKQRDMERAFLTQNGLAGFIFYGFVIGALVLETMGYKVLNPLSISLGIALPLLVIFMKHPIMSFVKKEPLKPSSGWGNYLVESFFELFEVLLGFVSNTLSFMRVGGFVLSHAGMMSVVMTLKQMSGSASIIVLILGNILVIGLEGLIVGIQTLRLQYYEIFSRFYDGGGKPFKSIN